ncbi:putative bifunctional diguanylate cyclase/phosphodiesterase [Dactylosporangium siamense]|uniref:putative bifunctional diguanylate cyclase/phosphodiesterase n=1 Tax=Dactylosporangium siamense TaxID=685454 RepID=UPI001944858F|nr:EAL domain-containing protein [Dactylosporangium siamense]
MRSHPALRGAVILAVLSTAWLAAQWPHVIVHPAIGWIPVPLSAGLAAAVCFRTARLAGPAGRFWRHLGIIMLILLGGVLSSAVDSLVGPGAPTQRSSSFTMTLYLGAVLVLVWALLRLPVRRRLITFGLDLAVVVCAVSLMTWFFAARGSVELARVTGTAWAIFGVVVLLFAGLLAVAKVALAGTGGLDRTALWVLGGTVIAGAALGAIAPLLESRPYLNDCHLSIPVCAAGITLAALVQRFAVVRVATPRAPSRPFSLLPYLAVIVADGFVLAGIGPDQRHTRVLVGGSVLLTLLVVARQLISFYENSTLLARVDASMLELRRHERRFRSLVQNSADIFAITDAAGRVTYASPSLLRFLGLSVEEILGATLSDRVHPDDLVEARRLAPTPAGTVTQQVRVRHADGDWRWFEVVSSNLLHDPSVRGIVSNARDITEARRYQDQLSYQASHDALTGLANRALFNTATTQAVRVAQSSSGTSPDRRRSSAAGLALALVDLDDFKAINDRLGHAVGDALLIEVSERLRASVRPGDTVARLGGDEFAVLLPSSSVAESARIAEAFIDALAAPVRAAGYELLIQASIGVARHTADCDASDLLRRADMAMYAAKELGKSRWVEYGPELDAHAVEHAQIAAELSQALDRDELFVLYQPIVGLPDGDVRGVEALIRWRHPTRGLVSPVTFIPVAERTGLIVPIGAWILRQACTQGAQWASSLGDRAPWKISVNASARQLLEPAFVGVVADTLADTGLDPARLTIEITETAVFGGGRALDTVRALHALGVKIALDDFGTGHSSLGLLRTCPVDVLKVDKSFVDGVTGTVEQEAIATSISEIAQALRLEAVAEGVETAEQASRLLELGYRLAQGFYFARPLPAAEIAPLCTPEPSLTSPA